MDEIQIDPIKDALKRLAREDESLGASPAVEAAMRTAFQRHRSRRTYSRMFLAAAAALVLGIAGALLWPTKAPATVAQKETAPTEVGTDYFPLRAGPVLDAGEIGQVMRVPASATLMARFGLTHAGSPANMFVKADVLVGMDGTARAVRFIR
jgi:hypothetical protein